MTSEYVSYPGKLHIRTLTDLSDFHGHSGAGIDQWYSAEQWSG
jgi:hypothetical protein